MAPAAVIFDLDGTIWDSRPFFAAILSTLTALPAQEFEVPVRGNVTSLVRRLGLDRGRFYAEAGRQARSLLLYRGVKPTLARLRAKGIPLGIASSLPGALVKPLLDGSDLSTFFTIVVASESGIPAKPNPAPLLTCLKRMGVTPSPYVFYVGDRDVDRQAAISAGVRFVWVRFGYGEGQVASSNDVQIERFAQLLDL